VGLGLNVLANLLLLFRFSASTSAYTSIATLISLLSWIGKTAVAAVNLILFGILTRNGPGYSFAEGFWCAVVSIIDAGIISCLLLLHYFYAFRHKSDTEFDLRMQGRQFMLSVTAFVFILAIQALAFNQIEGWSYLDSIYFSVQTALTIGFGDFTPDQAAGKALVFVFSVLTISQLGNEIALIIAFISAHANERRDRWRRRYEGVMHREANVKRPDAGLIEEMALIHQINSHEEM
jgi:potassium channel subfamily K